MTTTPSIDLKPCPAAGGVHTWVFYAACRAVEAGPSDDEAVEIIEPLMTRGKPTQFCGPVRRNEHHGRSQGERLGERSFLRNCKMLVGNRTNEVGGTSETSALNLSRVEAALARYEVKEVGGRR